MGLFGFGKKKAPAPAQKTADELFQEGIAAHKAEDYPKALYW